MAVRALSLVLLCTFVTVIFGLPALPEPAVNIYEERALSTELQPPALSSDETEHYATIYIINLFAVKNSSSNVSEEMFQNEVVETLPDIIEPLVSVILVVEDDENEESENHRPVDLDKFAEGLKDEGIKVDKIDLNSKMKVLKMKLEKAEAQSMIGSALKGEQKKFRQKRFSCYKGCGGGYGGGYGQQGYTGYALIPVYVTNTGGHRGHHGHGGHGGYGGHHGHGGCCGGNGGGGGGSYANAQAYASANSGSWGKK